MLKIRFFVLNLPGLMSQYSSILKKSKHYLSKVSLALVKVAIVVQYLHLPILFHINLPHFFQSAFKYAYNNVSDMYCYFRYVIYFNKLVCMTRPSSDVINRHFAFLWRYISSPVLSHKECHLMNNPFSHCHGWNST